MSFSRRDGSLSARRRNDDGDGGDEEYLLSDVGFGGNASRWGRQISSSGRTQHSGTSYAAVSPLIDSSSSSFERRFEFANADVEEHDPAPDYTETDETTARGRGQGRDGYGGNRTQWPLRRQPSAAAAAAGTTSRFSLDTEYRPGTSIGDDDKKRAPTMWNSFWLRTEVLASFAVLFTCLVLVTGLLYHFSQLNRGLSVQNAARHYGWTYGPTAFLTLVLSAWFQIDFAAKTLTPWKDMRRGPTSADGSVLLDYITPLVPVAAWRAIRSRHWAVVATVTGVFLIQLTTVFSTGLLYLQPTAMQRHNVAFAMDSSFDGSDFRLNRTTSDVGTNPTVAYYGTRLQGMDFPTGVSEDIAVPDFSPVDAGGMADGANYSAIVPGAQVGFDCEYLPGLNGTVTSLPWWSILAEFWLLNITTPSCNLTNVIVAEGPDHNMYAQENASQAYLAYFNDYICDSSIDYSLPWTPDGPIPGLPAPVNDTAEHRVVMSVADMRFTPYDAGRTAPEFIYMENLTVAICKPYYAMGDYEVKYTENSNTSAKSMSTRLVANISSEIDGFSPRNLGAAVQWSVQETYLGTGGKDWVLSVEVPSFYQILAAMNGDATIGVFMDPRRLISSGSEAFKGIATELIHQYMLKPAHDTNLTGSLAYSEDRLWVRSLSVGFMCALMGILVILSILLIFVRPFDVVSREPGSIAATATILAASPALRSLLAGLASARLSEIRRHLSSFTFQSKIMPGQNASFSIEPMAKGKQVPTPDEESEIVSKPFKWWVPTAIKQWFWTLAVLLPLVLIAVLEVIQHLSDQNHGFVNVDPDGFALTHGFATYIPAVFAFIVSGMFAGIRLSASVLAPWMALKRGSAPAARSVFLNLITKTAPHRLFLALRSRNYGLGLILLANFVAACFPIIVAGLYIVTSVEDMKPVSLQQSDVFDFKMSNLFYSDNLAGINAGLIVYKNLSYPKWTYKDLDFNALEATDSGMPSAAPGTQMPFATHVMATRPSLNCTAVDPAFRSISYDGETTYEGKIVMQVNTSLAWDLCDHPPAGNTTAPWVQQFLVPDGAPGYFGLSTVLSWTPDSGVVGYGPIDTDTNRAEALSYAPDYVANYVGGYGCPSFAATVGRGYATPYQTARNKTKYNFTSDMASVVCYQHFETVNTSVTLSLPSMALDLDAGPPTPDESTAEYVVNTQFTNFTSRVFEFPINTFLLTLTSATENQTVPGPDGGDASLNELDAFTTVLATMGNLTVADLAGNANVGSLADMTNSLYKTYMTQAVNFNMRASTTMTTTATAPKVELYSGLVPVPGHLRLTQQRGSKIALQAMLGFMVACAVAGRALMRGVIARTVPHNPCSIAGTAALLADGDICRPRGRDDDDDEQQRPVIPPGAEWMGDEELRKVGVFEGWLFSLGWWQEAGQERAGEGEGEGGEGGWKYGVDVGFIADGEEATK